MKTAVIYARYSSASQSEQSIEGQLRVCHNYAENNELLIVDEYIDRATTGTNDNRTSFQQLLKDSNKKAWDYVLVYKLDRFSRNKYEMAMHKKTLKDNGIKLLSAMENIPETPEGIILESLLEGMAEYYSAELSQKVKRGLNESRLKGNFTGGNISYGYKVVGDKVSGRKVVIDEDTSKVVKYIFEEYASGTTVKQIIENLKEKGITRNGNPFPKNTILHILHNDKYTGKYYTNGQEITNTYPRIISDELYNLVKLKNDINKYGKDSNISHYLLRGKVFCGYCGKAINGDAGTARNGTRIQYYNCNGRKYGQGCIKKMVKKELLENIVIDTTIKVLSKNHIISNIADLIISKHEKDIKDNMEINIILKDLDRIQNSINNLISAIEKGIITSSTKQRLDELELQKEEQTAKLKLAETKKKISIKKDNIIYHIKNCLRKEPKQIIEILVDRITLFDDKIEIKYRFDKNSPDKNQGCLFYTEIIKTKNIDLHLRNPKETDFSVQLYC